MSGRSVLNCLGGTDQISRPTLPTQMLLPRSQQGAYGAVMVFIPPGLGVRA